MITTVRELVKLLGGPQRVARECGITSPAVTNWCARDAVAAEHRLTIWRMASARGIAWTPPGGEGLALVPREAA